MVHAAWALWLVGVAGGLYLRYGAGAAKGGAMAAPKPAAQQAEAAPTEADGPPASNSSRHDGAAAKASQIEKQLEEARRALETLERQLQEERRAAEATKTHDDAAELSMRLVQEKERAGELMSEAGRWRQAAEHAQMDLSRLQREKAAAERAAEVLEQEVNMTRRQFQELKWHEEGVPPAPKFPPHAPIVGGAGAPSPDRYRARQGMLGSPNRGRMAELMSGGASPMGGADEVFSSSFSSPSTFASPPNPRDAFASTAASPATPSPYQPQASRHFGESEARPPVHPFRRGGQGHSFKESAMNPDAFAAFMGVDAGPSDLIGELEPSLPTPADPPPARLAGETRARGRRGGQRRKRAAGGGAESSDNAATDCLATSMALAALGDGL